ncbi:terpene synthase family protein [Burkholderia cenocepacia]|uniref:terpene synthase family protein n=1 Tax=Burkholderia cenocepacia TaxID=95486 RepID=UPI000F5B6B69|nr:terpene synthase family protein [Burkholderia cenocepacia]
MNDPRQLTPVPDTLVIPERYCPLLQDVNPMRAQLDASIEAWVQKFGLVRTEREWTLFHAAQTGLLTSLCYPRMPFETLEPAGHLCTWILQFDESGFEGPASRGDFSQTTANLARFQKIADAPQQPLDVQEPYWVALQDILLRLHKVATGEQLYRFDMGILRWLHGNGCELGYRVKGTMPTLQDFLVIRGNTAGSSLFASMIDMGSDRPISSAYWGSPALRALNLLGDFLYGIDNDIASYLRDAQSPRQLRWNVVDVLAHEYGISAEHAIQRACDMHREKMQQTADLCSSLRQHPDTGVREFATDFEYMMSGPWKWYQMINRYRVVDEF